MINISANNPIVYENAAGLRENELSLYVNSCGYQKFLTRDFSVERPKGTRDFQILYLLKGRAYYRLDAEETEVQEGSLVLYRPFQPQFYRYLAEDAAELYWLHFSGRDASGFLEKLDMAGQSVHTIGIQSECVELFQRIIEELQKKRPMFESITAACLQELLSLSARALSGRGINSRIGMSPDMEKIVSLIHANYHRQYSNRYYAEQCNLSLFRFVHKFKEATGMSPLEYITRVRMNEAKYLLAFSSLNISEISSIVGYENPLYFSKLFKRETGFSPSLFRMNKMS